jgi:ankyrin repeat protein
MNDILQDSFNSIIAYLPDLSINDLINTSKIVSNKVSQAKINNEFWKEHTEVFLGKKLKTRLVNWKEIYNILIKTGDEKKLIIAAIISGNPDVLSILIETGQDPSIYNKSVMIEAVRHNNPSIMKILLDDGRVNPAIGNNQAIMSACKSGFTEIAEILLEDERVNPNVQRLGAIGVAAQYGHTETVKALIKNKKINPVMIDNDPIKIAAEKGHTGALMVLLEDNRTDPTAEDNYAIRWSVKNGKIETVKILLKDRRVDPSANNNEAVISAVEFEQLEILKLLLRDHRVDPSVHNNSLIINASEAGQVDIVKLLIEDPRVIPPSSTLIVAIKRSRYEVIKTLLKSSKIDPSENNNDAIILALELNQLDTVELLLGHPKINVFTRYLLDKYPNLYSNITEYIRNSLAGLTAMHYLYSTSTSNNIYRDKPETNQNIIGLYYKFLRYIVRKKPTLLAALEKLIELTQQIIDIDTRLIIHDASSSILDDINRGLSSNVYYYAFRGFFMLAYIPAYTYKDIFNILIKEFANEQGIYLTAKLIGAQLGLNKLIDDGLVITNKLQREIDTVLNLDLINLSG